MIKNIAAVICIIFVLFSAGCSRAETPPGGTQTEAATSQASEKTVIRAINWHSERENAYNLIAESISSLYPEIEFVVENYNSNEYYSFLTVAIESGEAPDLFTSHGSKTNQLAEYVKNGVCEPLDSYIDVSGYPEILVERAMVDGTLYMNPGAFYDTFPVYYNVDLFREHGLSEPESYSDFIDICDSLVGLGITPFAYTAKDRWYLEFFNSALSAAVIPDWCQDFSEGKAAIDDPRFRSLLATVVDFGAKGYFGDDYLSIDGNAAKMKFIKGEAAMRIDGSWSLASYIEGEGSGFSLFYIPSIDGKDIINVGQDTCSGYSVYSRTPNKDAAIKVLQYLSTNESMQTIADLNQSVIALNTLKANSPTLKKLSTYDRSIPLWVDYMFPMALEDASPSDTIIESLQKMIYEGDSVEDAITNIENVLDYSKKTILP